VIFKANSFSDLLDRVSMVKEIAAADQRRLNEMNQVATAVTQAQKELEEEKKALEQTRDDLERSQAELDKKNQESDALLEELVLISEDMNALHAEFEDAESEVLDQIVQKDNEYNEKLEEEKEASRQASIQASIEESIQASVQASIEASIDASRKEEANQRPSSGSSGGSSSGGSSKSWGRPCSYSYVSSPFGYRVHPVTGKWTMHKGVDLVAPKGTPIYASRGGTVTGATYGSAAGYYVRINHGDGFSSIYMHMEYYTVSVGQTVSQGQVIGYVGKSGVASGYHLHFGISYNGAYVNPCAYVNLS
jgi:murein DD-endopeptidase MepM/ murein hydrolase activator NlpD